MDSIADLLLLALMARAQPRQQPRPQPQAAVSAPMIPIQGRVTERRMPALFAQTPAEAKASLAWERGDTNRGVLERALRREKRPFARELLLREHRELFGEG